MHHSAARFPEMLWEILPVGELAQKEYSLDVKDTRARGMLDAATME